ncbi:hypothetical protein [Streptomyces europaeiscabiei]|uniref:hypothetical protein n=1 Tax=Streptomyces europaeiscabiei TaxID=146819 RepID=UPI0029B228ED|nr:hypothetical protein [Streptomyces europaeiscabiei]MDX2767006.1 hypothetical protein [Streptomyces europaeiscabiei]
MTKGQRFAKDMRKNLGIGTRTRRWGSRVFKGSDMHRMVLDCIAEATHYNGMYSEGRQELFRAAFPALCSYEKHILGGRADAVLIAHLNGLSPWRLCNLLGEMVDAEITNVGQGERFFAAMARSRYAHAA